MGEPLSMDAIGVMSVNDLVDRLPELDGATVRVFGALTLGFEGDSVWHLPKKERVDGVPYRSSLWVDVAKLDRQALQQFSGRHVLISARVNAADTGHLGLWPGTLVVLSVSKP